MNTYAYKDSGKKSNTGYSLIEVMVSMSILAILALGMSSAIITARFMAESNVYQNTSFTVAQGYIEQIKSMEYGILTNALDAYLANKDTVDGLGTLNDSSWETNTTIRDIMLDTKSINALTVGIQNQIDLESDAPLYVGAWVEREVLVDIQDPDSENPREITMNMRFRPTMTNLRDAGPDVDALEIRLDYEFETRQSGSVKWLENSVFFVKSYAPTF